MRNLKIRLLNWLLKDEKLRKEALIEVVGDKEIKSYHINNSENIVIENCIVINTVIKECQSIKVVNNTVDKMTFSGNTMLPNSEL